MSRFGQRTRPNTLVSTWLVRGAFSPSQLAPALWLDASDTSTITSSSGAVSEWRDLSGNARHVVQATAANQPTTGSSTQNGLNVISFDGSDWLKTASSFTVDAPGSVWVVARNTRTGITASGNVIDGFENTNGRWAVTSSTVNSSAQLVATFSSGTSGTPRTTDVWDSYKIAGVVFKSGNQSMFVNGEAKTLTDALVNPMGSFTGANIGRYNGLTSGNGLWLGQIAEVIVLPSELSTADRLLLEKYLNDKWAVY